MKPVGDAAFLVEVDSPAAAHRIRAVLQERTIRGVREAVAGAESVLITVGPAGCDEPALQRAVESAAESGTAPGREVRIPVRYDGPDLAAVAEAAGLSVPEVISVHSGRTYTAAFLGFSPGFAYLVGLDSRLVLPRRPSPRTRVPAGSVAIAGEHTAVYPQQTPGGWHLIGTTELAMFDPDRAEPAVLRPGDSVRFEEVPCSVCCQPGR